MTQPESQPEMQKQAPTEEIKWGRIVIDILEMLVLAVVLFVGINAVSCACVWTVISTDPTSKTASSCW